MGREAAIKRARECKGCNRLLFVAGRELAEHARLCERVRALGMVLVQGIDQVGVSGQRGD